MRHRVFAVLVVTIAVLLTWIVWIAVGSYLRAPRLVADLEREGVLSFSPPDLPKARLCALLVVQDPTFFRHQGIGLNDGHLGHTTLTQSLGKGLFFEKFEPGLLHHRKFRLMVAAWTFDRRISKTTQLRIFLNRTYFGTVDGRGILGFPAAATAFFGKDLQNLTEREYLALLAMLDAPNRYHVLRNPRANAERVRSIEQQVQRACGEDCFQGDAPVPCATQLAFR